MPKELPLPKVINVENEQQLQTCAKLLAQATKLPLKMLESYLFSENAEKHLPLSARARMVVWVRSLARNGGTPPPVRIA